MSSDFTATYSPEDNKLRMYAAYRLDKEDYNRFKKAGFSWAPKQELFVAPKWTPAREDLLIEFCGSVGDEDTSLVDRAEIRSERFEDYSTKRANDANSAHGQVKSLADGIPFGQPILVGHHSEKRARKDAEKIEKGMIKAVKLWETSQYWEMRAAGALSHAKYKNAPGVRVRRIKKIEAENRKYIASYTPTEKHSKFFIDQTRWNCPVCGTYYCQEHEEAKKKVPHVFCGNGRAGSWVAVESLERIKKAYARSIKHNENRLLYEKAMLESQGASDLLKPKARPKLLPLLNYKAPEGITTINPAYYAKKTTHMPQVELTKAEFKAIYSESRGVRKVNGTHRVRVCMQRHIPALMEGLTGLDRTNAGHSTCTVFLTDSKIHPRPEEVTKEKDPYEIPMSKDIKATEYKAPERTKFDDIKDSLKAGVKTVSAPQLFPTPKELAEKMANYANVSEGESVLEPSAGTGMLLGAIGCRWYETGGKCVAVELNQALCDSLKVEFPISEIIQGDFLEMDYTIGMFDKIIMNPPFKNGSDIEHIKHAAGFLNPGGTLVALCANGPRQNRELKDMSTHWEDLPEGSFKNSGTMVNTALLVINN